ncbi:protein bric-a-brac 2 isoform X3 [Bicyclus anynana]|uniref:Protein bric-a-brac 2 isoform X3 n=1 Tax=Bicyclus anynana TaxID=110368 RepID=A0ABM3LJ33_BICAN|nr:protein bric-a-brac 2 isoform X3 [Bicyclus anynana]
MALPPQQFCVRWNSYHTNLQAVFPRLLLTEQFADVTLACESRQLRCHKLVLSACSAYLERLLLQNPCKHPIVLMRDMRFSEMQALVDFMYKGEVNVTQEELPSLLKSAEALQIRGLCSGEAGAGAGAEAEAEAGTRDFTLASDALLHAHRSEAYHQPHPPHPPRPPHQPSPKPGGGATNGPKKRKSEERERERERERDKAEVKEETVEEDGLYYGELDNEHLDYNEEEETGKPGSSLGQTSEFAIANVQCQYECSDTEPDERARAAAAPGDHTYDTRDEPPAFIIHQLPPASAARGPFVEVRPGLLTLAPGCAPAVNVIHIPERAAGAGAGAGATAGAELGMNKRIRRSEGLLRQAADCVSRGSTFQTVSERFNIPISTIRFFMARKGILPRRRRGRSTQVGNLLLAF